MSVGMVWAGRNVAARKERFLRGALADLSNDHVLS